MHLKVCSERNKIIIKEFDSRSCQKHIHPSRYPTEKPTADSVHTAIEKCMG